MARGGAASAVNPAAAAADTVTATDADANAPAVFLLAGNIERGNRRDPA